MAVLTANNPTLLDHALAHDPDGQVAQVVEMLNQTNEILADMSFIEGNLPTGMVHTIRTGLPAGTWRKLYGGVQPDKSTREKVTDSCGMLEAYAQVDKALADLSSSVAAYRMSEARAFLEGMSQQLSTAIFYGNSDINPEQFTGLSPRYNSLSAQNADNIIDAGGTGSNNRSIWLVFWGEDSCHGIVPKNSQAGIQINDKGQVTVENVDGVGGMMEAYRTHFRLDAGLTVRDWRFVVRICNIDPSLLTTDASTGADLPDLMFSALERIPNMGSTMRRGAFYMPRQVREVYRKQLAFQTKQSTLTYENVGGIKSAMFNEVPLRRVDTLAADEARVV